MSTEKIVSVVIPVYNVEKYLGRCINSVLNQTFKKFELILVNDGSKDKSLEICKEYEKRDSRIKVINTSNHGSSSARNTGMSYASGEWIIHFDSDDWVEPNILQLLYEKAISEDVDIVACGLCMDDGEGNTLDCPYPYNDFEPHSEIYRVEGQYSSVCNKLVRRELYDKYNIRFVDGVRMWEDLVVTTRLRYHSRKTVIVNKPLYHYFCAPRESICVSDVHKFPHSQIMVVEFLIEYFNSLSSSDPLINKIIACIKISAKNYIFSIESEDSYNQWKNLYKDANKRILDLRYFPLKVRLCYYLASKLSYKQFITIRSIKKKLLFK